MKTKKVLIIGGGGNASVIAFSMIEAFQNGAKELEFVGYVNDKDGVDEIEGYPVVGGLKDIPQLIEKDYYFINTIGKIGFQKDRLLLIESLNIPDERWVTFIHPKAYVAPTVKMGPGCVVMPCAIVQPGTLMGKCCRVMVGAIVGHNNHIGNYCFFAGGSITGAYLNVGDAVHVSINATVREFLKLENYSTVGMGAVLLKNMAEGEIWIGNPARLYKKTM